MRSNKVVAVLVIVAIAVTALVSSYARDWKEQQEKTRLEAMLTPLIEKTTEGTPDPKPSLSFITVGDKSVVVVLSWAQKPEAPIKNDMRERILTSVRRELSSDPKSWGRHVSVIFDDEVVTQGWK